MGIDLSNFEVSVDEKLLEERVAKSVDILVKEDQTLVNTDPILNVHGARETPIRSEDRQKLENLYHLILSVIPPEATAEFNHTFIRVFFHKEPNYHYTKYSNALAEYFRKEGKKVDPLPEIVFDTTINEDNTKFFRSTGKYFPKEKKIVVYCEGRHPKDILKSFCHELVHHSQNLEGRLDELKSTNNVHEDKLLEELEREAYLDSAIIFRKWEDSDDSKDLRENGQTRDVSKEGV